MFSYASAMAALRSLQRRYAFIACRPIGTTEYGRELTHVRIGCGRRRVLLTAAHHANEWITALVLLAFLEDYAAAFAAGQCRREEGTARLLLAGEQAYIHAAFAAHIFDEVAAVFSIAHGAGCECAYIFAAYARVARLPCKVRDCRACTLGRFAEKHTVFAQSFVQARGIYALKKRLKLIAVHVGDEQPH